MQYRRNLKTNSHTSTKFQLNKIEYKNNIKINTHNSIYIDINNKQIQNVCIVHVLVAKGYVF